MSSEIIKIDIPVKVKNVMERLESCGEQAFIVGGCVRDGLLGKIPADYDIATSAMPEKVLEVFSDYRVIETGIKHGTVTVMSDDVPLEITTFRCDGKYSDKRHPDSVSFVSSITEDLSRRDFTINAMAYNDNAGLVDPYGGRADINAAVIRCVGKPRIRFEEDALRIMRAVRFASVTGFEIEEETKRAVFECKELLRDVAAERIATELMKLLCGEYVCKVVKEYIDILGVWMPELLAMKNLEQHNPYHIYDVLTHTAVAVGSIVPVKHLRLTALLHDSGKPSCYTVDEQGIGHFRAHPVISAQIARAICRRLKLDNETCEKVEVLVYNHDVRMNIDEKTVRQWLSKLTPPLFFDLLQMKRADIKAQNPDKIERLKDVDKLEKFAHDLLEKKVCLSLSDMCVNGDDLIALGYKQESKLGTALATLLEKVVNEELENNRQELLSEAKKMLNNAAD